MRLDIQSITTCSSLEGFSIHRIILSSNNRVPIELHSILLSGSDVFSFTGAIDSFLSLLLITYITSEYYCQLVFVIFNNYFPPTLNSLIKRYVSGVSDERSASNLGLFSGGLAVDLRTFPGNSLGAWLRSSSIC